MAFDSQAVPPSGGFRVPEWPIGEPVVADAAPMVVLRERRARRSLQMPRKLSAVKSAAVGIVDGLCSNAGGRELRPMSRNECSQYAKAIGKDFIGASSEDSEFAGCVLWGGQHIEYNQHNRRPSTSADVPCDEVAKKSCICMSST